MPVNNPVAQAALEAATTTRVAADHLEALAAAMEAGDVLGGIRAITDAMAAFDRLEDELCKVRDAGLVATAKLKPTGRA